MKERKEIDRSKEREEEEKQRFKDHKRMAEKGVVSGSALAGIGTGIYALAKKAERIHKSGKEKWVSKKIPTEKLISRGKIVGLSALGLGLPTLGISAYKHYKYKKKEKR